MYVCNLQVSPTNLFACMSSFQVSYFKFPIFVSIPFFNVQCVKIKVSFFQCANVSRTMCNVFCVQVPSTSSVFNCPLSIFATSFIYCLSIDFGSPLRAVAALCIVYVCNLHISLHYAWDSFSTPICLPACLLSKSLISSFLSCEYSVCMYATCKSLRYAVSRTKFSLHHRNVCIYRFH